MAVLSKGTTFATGDQVTASNLNAHVDSATFASGAVDNVSTQLSSGAIIVKDGGISTAKIADSSVTTAKLPDSTGASDGVTFAKLQQAAANTVLVRDANSTGAVSAKAVADTEILIGDGTGFTAASLSGDATMTNAGVVTVSSVASGATGVTASAGDNSTKLATTEYVETQISASTKVASFTKSSQSSTLTELINGYTESDPDGIASESAGTFTVTGAGTYLCSLQGIFDIATGGWNAELRKDGSAFATQNLGSGQDENLSYTIPVVISSGSFTLDIRVVETSAGSLSSTDVRIDIVKIA